MATLVPRFHDVAGGAVRIGGVDVREVDPAVLYRHVGFVLQDVQLLGISIAENIRLGRADATDEEIDTAAEAAHIHDRILDLPNGYDSVVGEDAHFSGGEAQRVSIARALLADTPILVLDEATAFADPDSEAQIQAALSRLIEGRTVLVIAHRLGSVVGADNIVVLDDGRVAEQGRHDELIDRGGQYARMWTSTPTVTRPGVGGGHGDSAASCRSSVRSAGRMYAYLAWVTVYGVLHGIAMILLVPISVALFDGDFAAAGRWLRCAGRRRAGRRRRPVRPGRPGDADGADHDAAAAPSARRSHGDVAAGLVQP